MFQWVQERTLIITDETIYNIKKNTVKRQILLTKVQALIKTIGSNTTKEFTLHIPTEYDYRFISDKRDEIV